MYKESFNNILRNSMRDGDFPLGELLSNSLYYPASNHDGGMLRVCNTIHQELGIQSFIYCDYSVCEEALLLDAKTIRGYHIAMHRRIRDEELMPTGYRPTVYVDKAKRNARRMFDNGFDILMNGPKFIWWFILERDDLFDESHGPQLFSLLFICGEGVSMLQNLFTDNHIAPKVLAIIQPGYGFGGNWTNFRQADGVLYKTLFCHPEYVFYGGYGNKTAYEDSFPWPFYRQIDTVHHYYHLLPGTVCLCKNVNFK